MAYKKLPPEAKVARCGSYIYIYSDACSTTASHACCSVTAPSAFGPNTHRNDPAPCCVSVPSASTPAACHTPPRNASVRLCVAMSRSRRASVSSAASQRSTCTHAEQVLNVAHSAAVEVPAPTDRKPVREASMRAAVPCCASQRAVTW